MFFFSALRRTHCCTYRGFRERLKLCHHVLGAEKTMWRWLQSVAKCTCSLEAQTIGPEKYAAAANRATTPSRPPRNNRICHARYSFLFILASTKEIYRSCKQDR